VVQALGERADAGQGSPEPVCTQRSPSQTGLIWPAAGTGMKQIAITPGDCSGLGQPRRCCRFRTCSRKHLATQRAEVSDASLHGCGRRPAVCGSQACRAFLAWNALTRWPAAAAPYWQTAWRQAQDTDAGSPAGLFRKARNALDMTREAIQRLIASTGDHAQLEPVDDLTQQCARGG